MVAAKVAAAIANVAVAKRQRRARRDRQRTDIGAGDGGTVELLAWLVAMGAAGNRKAETMFYVPSVPLRCGMGGVDWNVAS